MFACGSRKDLLPDPPMRSISLSSRTSVSEADARNSPVAQLVEQAAVNRWVVGSSPTGGAFSICGIAADPRVYTKRRARERDGVSLFPEFRQGLTTSSTLDESSRFFSPALSVGVPGRQPRQNSRALGLNGAAGLTTRLGPTPRNLALNSLTTPSGFTKVRYGSPKQACRKRRFVARDPVCYPSSPAVGLS